MDFDSKGLGRLRRVANARDVWTSEAGDFTPWLAENLDVLAEELGITLTMTATEVPVGDFRLDIQAESGDGRLVVIENQLERTDHSHLGQLLVYASGLEAATVVWVAPRFRDDHRRTLDWLNERTDTGVDFFGVEVSVVQIGVGGPRAPVFSVVARPNDWQKGVKEVNAAVASAARGNINAARQDFFAEVLSDVVSVRPGIRLPSRASQNNWMSFAAGPWGNWGLVAANDGRLRVEAYIDAGDASLNKGLFDELFAENRSWERAAGVSLLWERLDEKRASRIYSARTMADLDDAADREELKVWAVKATLGMYDALNAHLRARAFRLRELIRTPTCFQIFWPEPEQWGLRGDDYLWRALRSEMAELVPNDPKDGTAALRAQFRQDVGVEAVDPQAPESVYVERFAHGGMSSGQVHLPTWRERLLPLLEERMRQLFPMAP